MKLAVEDRRCAACNIDISEKNPRAIFCSKKCYNSPRFRGTHCKHCNSELVIARQSVGKTRFCSYRCVYLYKNPDLNEKFFSEPNLENSYWAGFIAADGCIHVPRSGDVRVIIRLKRSDAQHLQNLKGLIGGGVVYNDKTVHKITGKTYESTSYSLCSSKICADLANNFNIHPQKSLTHEPPELDGDLAIAFIAGYIDGDGSYYVGSTRPNINIRGTFDFLSWVASIYEMEKVPKFDSGTHRVSFHGNDAILVRNSFKDLSLPLLKRKVGRWEELGANLAIL